MQQETCGGLTFSTNFVTNSSISSKGLSKATGTHVLHCKNTSTYKINVQCYYHNGTLE
jgi:hypothetical protein